jgi:subtilisin family serine protease
LDASGSGSWAGVIAGVDWVVAQRNIKVVNMSLGGKGTLSTLDTAIQKAVSTGIAFAVAAGNDNALAQYYTPANIPNVLVVSALADGNGQSGGGSSISCFSGQNDDFLATFSNYGTAVDIAAPGVCIRSTWLNGSYNTISGTSMASPHVAGALALLASKNPPQDLAGVTSLYNTLKNNGNYLYTDQKDGTKEPLLDVSKSAIFNPRYVGLPASPTSAPAPTASPTTAPPVSFSCAGLTQAQCQNDTRCIAQFNRKKKYTGCVNK